jgi:glucosamine 6-phosphate synthetase-like amidotransferase/phosphosugar isomerase protein
MCGIVAAVAQRNVVPILLEGLKRLEYRGYDSAGVAVINGSPHGEMKRLRSCGRVAELEKLAGMTRLEGRIGIEARRTRDRSRRKAKLRVVPEDEDEAEAFAASVERDLSLLPTVDERDERRR